MCATIRTSPLLASVATQVISPSASNLGANASPSSTSWVEPRGAKDAASAKAIPLPAPRRSRGSAPGAHHRHEARLLIGLFAEAAGELRRDGACTGPRDAADRHAHMLGFQHHRDAGGFEDLIDRGRD